MSLPSCLPPPSAAKARLLRARARPDHSSVVKYTLNGQPYGAWLWKLTWQPALTVQAGPHHTLYVGIQTQTVPQGPDTGSGPQAHGRHHKVNYDDGGGAKRYSVLLVNP